MSLKAIDKKTVHQICSGQVVLSLATAVKELVENALDAGATNIEVRVKEYGVDLVEVTDNGCGVEEANFQGLTLKHHTSKIRDFSDLEVGVSTYGFRGEALSSLCALSDLAICTCHKASPTATKLEYDHNGVIKTQVTCAREVGTTVSLSRLFHTLPVRHKEFNRNKKKEYNKMLLVLQGYCLVSTNIRISCFHQQGKSKKQQVLATSGNSSIRGNVVDVFGTKQLDQLLELRGLTMKDLSDNEATAQLKQQDLDKFRFSGFISRCNHGYGRSSTDRQFYFFNNRPCDHSKLTRVVNEVYHSHNRHQYPCVVLSIETNKESVDVNITPDKRQVMLHEETKMLLLVKVLLVKLYEPTQGNYENRALLKTNTTPTLSRPSVPAESPATPSLSKFLSIKRSNEAHHGNGTPNKQMRLNNTSKESVFQSSPLRSNSDRITTTACREEAIEAPIPHGAMPDEVSKTLSPSKNLASKSMDVCDNVDVSDSGEAEQRDVESVEEWSSGKDEYLLELAERQRQLSGECTEGGYGSGLRCGIAEQMPAICSSGSELGESSCKYDGITSSTLNHSNASTSSDIGDNTRGIDQTLPSCGRVGVGLRNDATTDTKNIPATSPTRERILPQMELDSPMEVPSGSTIQSVHFDLDAISARLKALATGNAPSEERSNYDADGLKFRTKINPSSNTEAEDELRKEIRKSDFPKMKIIGQFNLGFIITRLGSDLFIVDQHATDEKYNFERLQRETVIQHQNLLVPKSLELTSVSENVIMNNLHVFEMNGFQFQIDDEAPPMHKLKLVAKPISRNWSMEKNEIEELVFMLSDDGCQPGEVVRPSAVRAMFASRSCRSSIMIGTALRESDMRKLINHMAETDQPWNCPHGRPTMRHLINLNRIQQH